jgi:hypothetical protein
MPFWIEIRCAGRGSDCWSHRNAGPQKLCDDGREIILQTVAMIESDARRKGWRRTKQNGWLCPVCIQVGTKPGSDTTVQPEAESAK